MLSLNIEIISNDVISKHDASPLDARLDLLGVSATAEFNTDFYSDILTKMLYKIMEHGRSEKLIINKNKK